MESSPEAGDPANVVLSRSGEPIPGVRSALLPVALDRRLRPDVSAFGVEAGGTARPALPEQVPALVQADRELTQALTVLAGESLANVALFQPVLLGQEPLDLGEHISVVHGLSLCRRHTHARTTPARWHLEDLEMIGWVRRAEDLSG